MGPASRRCVRWFPNSSPTLSYLPAPVMWHDAQVALAWMPELVVADGVVGRGVRGVGAGGVHVAAVWEPAAAACLYGAGMGAEIVESSYLPYWTCVCVWCLGGL